MAGIGFSLQKLFNKKGILNLCKAYGYSGIVTIGPMILGVTLLVGVSRLSKIAGLTDFQRDLLNSMLTYTLLLALLVTTIFNMVVTRFVSDMIYQGSKEKIMPSFYGMILLEMLICIVVYTPFLLFSVENAAQCILCLWLSVVLTVVWSEMIYLTAVKDFAAIVLTFAIALMFGFLLAIIAVLSGLGSLESFLFCVIMAYGVLAVRQFDIMIEYFPKSYGSSFSFLRYFDKYPELCIAGIMIRIGLFSHLIVMYFGPLGVNIKGGFYGAPQYDVPGLAAFFSLLITTVSFVVSVEVNFYPKYSNYYGLFAEKGSIKDIKLAEAEMLDMMKRELVYLGCKQLFTTILFVVAGPPVMETVFPGLSSLSLSIFKFLCVGYGVYAIANSVMLIELYFEDYKGAAIGAGVFAVASTGTTMYQVLYGDPQYFGVGFALGAMAFYVIVLTRLERYTRKLPYYLLSRQNLVQDTEKGFFTGISMKLEERWFLQEEKIGKKGKTAEEGTS